MIQHQHAACLLYTSTFEELTYYAGGLAVLGIVLALSLIHI